MQDDGAFETFQAETQQNEIEVKVGRTSKISSFLNTFYMSATEKQKAKLESQKRKEETTATQLTLEKQMTQTQKLGEFLDQGV